MKKLLTILVTVVAVASMSFGQSGEKLGIRPYNWHPKNQVSTQSLAVNTSSTQVSVLWLRDGLSNNYTAISYPVFQVTGLGNRVNLVAIGAFDSNFSKKNIYTGTGASLNLVKSAGWSVDLYGAWKGFNLGDNFKASSGRDGWVYGIGVQIPIR